MTLSPIDLLFQHNPENLFQNIIKLNRLMVNPVDISRVWVIIIKYQRKDKEVFNVLRKYHC